MKTIEAKNRIGSNRTKKNSALSKLKLPDMALPDGVADYPSSIMKRGKHYERVREIYCGISHAVVNYGALAQAIDSTIILMASINYKVYEDCLPFYLDPKKRLIEEAKSHVAKDALGNVQTTLKEHPNLKIMRDAEQEFRNHMNTLGLTIVKRASIMGTLSLYNSMHSNSNNQQDPFAKFFVAQEMA